MESWVNLGGDKVIQKSISRQSRDLNPGPRGWKTEILPVRQPRRRHTTVSKMPVHNQLKTMWLFISSHPLEYIAPLNKWNYVERATRHFIN